ncbi:hypothetical protein TCAL_05534 [Tigriopus californicus]|uniref:Arrestin C-terminal-like domain-containing protein n=1 Tax=Tigriopus californicus TaxID=6832 RepID=A0A553P8H6_TIGCA|nr:arrestin domain-containing protein 3-like [Tigriopus californicus]XP_059080633.1 arrestin domain-containing protein 3-like [Tigriopus californicus]TRY73991.1 hypothetical protein TCAL_05534 [Tigriopus californicus]|eukprot:TCALIF_05534-PA protein Name:"Similar to Arrdc3 Arrestin domain-containing protein 3 (Mus musculus)" AED:0.06 eAED:0.06 QI:210/1/1/1/0.8/0.66/6/268/433
MMGVQNVQIFFDNSPQGIYFPGQTIHGRVKVEVQGHQAVNIRGVSVKFQGGSLVRWTETVQRSESFHHHGSTGINSVSDGSLSSGRVNRQEIVVHSNHEEYFKSKFFVFGNGQNVPIFPGEHVFSFSYILPANLPSSFESTLGHIRYQLEARVDRPWALDKVSKTFFTINGILDLNLEPGVNAPVQVMDHKTMCCWCCRSGPISALVMLPKSGFVPGEAILLEADVDNMSNRLMNRTQARLIQTVRYQATDASKVVENPILKADQGQIPPGESQTWNDHPLRIPALPPSGPRGCSIIHISYKLEFHVEPSSVGMSLILSTPITIGSIPTQNSFNQFQGNSQGYPSPSPFVFPINEMPPPYSDQVYNPPKVNVQPSAPSLLMMEQYPDLPPPSYIQAVNESRPPRIARMDDDHEDTTANWEFVPQYAVYQPKSA